MMPPLSVHLIDGTYELFRQFYGRRRFENARPAPFGAVAGVLHSILEMIEKGATHIGVATDHVIESFRNGLWPGYKTGDGIERALRAQFVPLEQALGAMGVVVWPMIELEADDALASAARAAAADKKVQQVCIWTPDKDLAQCVRGDRVVQVLRSARKILDAVGVRAKFGVDPERIPDFLALVGDASDGYPGLSRHRPRRRSPAHQYARQARGFSTCGAREKPGTGAAVQGSRHAEVGCATIRSREGTALARPYRSVFGVDGTHRRREAAHALSARCRKTELMFGPGESAAHPPMKAPRCS
jgi:hypothetical protein